MDDNSSISKAAKRNRKRHKRKKGGASDSTHNGTSLPKVCHEEICSWLKEQLEIAKTNKDHEKAGELREQIWVLNDIIAGVKTKVREDQLEAIIASIPLNCMPSSEVPTSPPASSTVEVLSEPEKRIRKLHKKLDAIAKLKEKLAKGESLDKNQEEKLKTEAAVKEEIDELQKLVDSVLNFT